MSEFNIKPFSRPRLFEGPELPPSRPVLPAPQPASLPVAPKEQQAPKTRKPSAKTITKPVPFRLPRMEKASSNATRYELKERIGTGGTRGCEAFPNQTLRETVARRWLTDYAEMLQQLGYAVEFHDNKGWFVATHLDRPSIWVAFQEVAF